MNYTAALSSASSRVSSNSAVHYNHCRYRYFGRRAVSENIWVKMRPHVSHDQRTMRSIAILSLRKRFDLGIGGFEILVPLMGGRRVRLSART